jgi:hypothetical protein
VQKHPEKNMNLETELLRLNVITYPYYVDNMDKMNVNRFINVSEISGEQLYDTVFENLIKMISGKVYGIGKIVKPDYDVNAVESTNKTDTFIDTKNIKLYDSRNDDPYIITIDDDV